MKGLKYMSFVVKSLEKNFTMVKNPGSHSWITILEPISETGRSLEKITAITLSLYSILKKAGLKIRSPLCS
jgi:hypothetical protein